MTTKHIRYRGKGVDRMSTCTGAGNAVYWTRYYGTWEAAQRAAERGLNRRGYRGERYAIEVHEHEIAKATGEA